MPASTTGSLAATGSVTLTKPGTDTMGVVQVSGTYGSLQFVIEGSFDGTNFSPVAAVDVSTGEVATGTLSPTDNATRTYKVDAACVGLLRARVTSIGSGTADFMVGSGSFVGQPFNYVHQTSQTLSGALALAAGITFNGGNTANVLSVPDNYADALNVKEGSTSYLKFVTTNSSEGVTLGVNLTVADAKNVVLNTTTGTKIGTATTQKLAFYNSTPVVQPATTGTTTGFTAGAGTAAKSDSTFTGGTGSAAYTVGDVVLALKTLGLLAA